MRALSTLVIMVITTALVNSTIVDTGTTASASETSTGSLTSRGTKKYEGTEAEAVQDLQDNIADASMASYSSVVYHHRAPTLRHNHGSGKTSSVDTAVPSRSESYFKFYNPGSNKERPLNGDKPATTVRNFDQSKGRTMPKIRYVENFRADEARASHGLPTHYHSKQPQVHESAHFQNHNTDTGFKSETIFGSSTKLNEHKEQQQRGFDQSLNRYKKLQPPPGMTPDLMETLLQQHPQTFQDSERLNKKTTSGKVRPSSFNVGYSIGFGKPAGDDIVFGKPKDTKLHLNGQKSVWKQLHGGVEMSEDLDYRKPVPLKVYDSSTVGAEPHVSVLSNGKQSLFYMNNHSPDIGNVPTSGKVHFDHQHALSSTNAFDFSNAVNAPIALPLQSAPAPVVHAAPVKHSSRQPKGPKGGQDLMNFYQSLGYSAPVPVYIPGNHGEGKMVQAIVIPLESLNNFQMNWGTLANTFTDQGTPKKLSPSSFEKSAMKMFKNHRKPNDSIDAASTLKVSPTISMPPISITNRPYNLQREQASLNAILAKEMSRKNQRNAPFGLRPPPAQYS